MDERKVDARKAAGEFEAAARDSYKAAVDHAFEVQKGGMRLSRRFFEDWVETLEDQAELNRRTLEGLRELARAQSEVFDEASRESLDAYDGFLDSLSDYHEEVVGDESSKD
ncbi:MAG: hypothetical protein ACRDTR_00470 [Rubrobacter sp.]